MVQLLCKRLSCLERPQLKVQAGQSQNLPASAGEKSHSHSHSLQTQAASFPTGAGPAAQQQGLGTSVPSLLQLPASLNTEDGLCEVQAAEPAQMVWVHAGRLQSTLATLDRTSLLDPVKVRLDLHPNISVRLAGRL